MKKAFTLIELLVVIAIIGVLTAITLAQFQVVKARARDAKRISDISQIQLAIQQYFDRCNQYPSAIGTGVNSTINLASNVGCPYDTSGNRITLNAFMGQVPTAPSETVDNSNPYTYRYLVHSTGGINDDYYLVARLEQPNKALDGDIDGTIPSSTSGWTGWSLSGSFGQINGNDNETTGYMYVVRSR